MLTKLIELSKSVPRNPNAMGKLHDILSYLAGVTDDGTPSITLVPNKTYKYSLEPVVDKHHWKPGEYDREKQYLMPYRDELIKLLRRLS